MNAKLIRNYLPEVMALGMGRKKPSMVTVNLTNRCNQGCLYCEIGVDPPGSSMHQLSRSDMKWIIDEMHKEQIRKISLCGGEPFLYEDLMWVVDYAWQQKIRCSITTNGMTIHKLPEQDIKKLFAYEAGINISVDSFNHTVQSLTRGNDHALENALKSIRHLQQNGVFPTVLTVISKHNFQGLFEHVLEAHRLGVKQVLFQPVISVTNYPGKQVLHDKHTLNMPVSGLDELFLEMEKILKFERFHDIRTNVYRIKPWIQYYILSANGEIQGWFFEKILRKFYCREVDAIIDITYDGGIQPCGLAESKVNIHDHQGNGLIALWNQATRDLKSTLDKGHFIPACNACCHHFSRNMLTSIFRFPIANHRLLRQILSSVLLRISSDMMKKLKIR
ncbi:MAG: radical SAM protein [Bacteroidetes bacterium]|nr:radical SAM protein [Bacteroidota bacterium]